MKAHSAKPAERRPGIYAFDSQIPDPGTKSETTHSGKRKRSQDVNCLRKEKRRYKLKRRDSDSDELEEERAKPTKVEYDHVRQALILARAAGERKDAALKQKDATLERLTREMEEKDRIITDKRYLLLKYSEVQDKIREMKDAGVAPRPMDNGLAGRGDDCETVHRIQKDVPYPGPTESITNMLATLRSSIREFANKYFSGKLQIPSMARLGTGWAHQYMQATTPGADTYMDYLYSQNRCPMVITAFIWRFLCGTVFNSVPWGGNENIRRHVMGLQDLLGEFHNTPQSSPEQMKAYQDWRRQTTEMVLQIHRANTAPADSHLSQLEASFSDAISEVVIRFMRSSPAGHKNELNKIMRQAIALDMEMSRQLPRYTWRFSNKQSGKPFNFRLGQEDVMKLHSVEKTMSKLSSTAAKARRVSLVVAPGLTRRGQDNSPSTSFEVECWVAPMEVTCVRPKRTQDVWNNL